jgi:hypothetical protein
MRRQRTALEVWLEGEDGSGCAVLLVGVLVVDAGRGVPRSTNSQYVLPFRSKPVSGEGGV